MYEKTTYQPLKTSYILIQACILGLFFIFVTRFWFLQVYKGEEYAARARQNTIRLQSIYAPRGLIRDAQGRILAENEPAYALAIIREDSGDVLRALEQVSLWTGRPLEDILAEYERGRRRVKSFEPQMLVPNLSFELLARIESEAMFWPELKIVTRPRRTYLHGTTMAHILGYVAQANEQELNADPGLRLGDNVGKQGIEHALEEVLRGSKGLRQVEVDATGRQHNERILEQPRVGESISLSIDLELQQHIADLMQDQAGAVVVMEPLSGQVVSLVSEPSFNSNIFVEGVGRERWQELLSDPRHPLQNRAIQSAYPPGSVFKLAMAGCALSSPGFDADETVYCPGQYRLGNRVFRCWKKQGHGKVDLNAALVESCDVYFYRLGERLGVDVISAFATASGFGLKTGIELPHERDGLMPDREWKKKRFGVSWQGGETLNMSIGQGYSLVTPLQVARFVSALVNGGDLLRPTLVQGGEPEVVGRLPVNEQVRRFIVDSMVATVESERGTARRMRSKEVTIGAKTGTAQVVRLMEEFEEKETDEIPYRYRDHAWIATFGSNGQGKSYVVVVLIEHGGHGSSAAGPVAKAVYEKLFQQGTD